MIDSKKKYVFSSNNISLSMDKYTINNKIKEYIIKKIDFFKKIDFLKKIHFIKNISNKYCKFKSKINNLSFNKEILCKNKVNLSINLHINENIFFENNINTEINQSFSRNSSILSNLSFKKNKYTLFYKSLLLDINKIKNKIILKKKLNYFLKIL